MSEATNDRQLMNQYLLGLLPEADAERLDELSVADDKFAARLADAENDLVDAYSRDELTGNTLEQFRIHYLASPTRREKVKFAFALRETTQSLSAVDRPTTQDKSSRRDWFAGLFAIPALQWGSGLALLAVLLVSGWLVIDNVRLRRQSAESQAKQKEIAQREQELRAELEGQRDAAKQTEREFAQLRAEQSHIEQQKPAETGLIATLFLTPQMRSAAQLPTVKIEPTTKSVAAHLTLEPNDFPSYQVALIDQTNRRTIWSSGILKPKTRSDSKVLNVEFRSDLLNSHSFVLRVSGIGAGGAPELISDYPFKVVK